MGGRRPPTWAYAVGLAGFLGLVAMALSTGRSVRETLRGYEAKLG